MSPKKIFHIYSDPKFLYFINSYSSPLFDNQLVFTGKAERLPPEYRESAILLPSDKEDRITKLLNICKSADLITINFLNATTVKLILSLPKNIKIIWRFYGAELYTREPKLFYSKATLKYWKPKVKKTSFINQVKQYIWHLLHPEKNYKLLLERIDYFLGVMDDEHALLKSIGYDLPPFIQFPFAPRPYNEGHFDKSPLIIFGNSRNKDNNHLDILELLRNRKLPKDLKIKMFFSYGTQDDYSQEVKEQSKQIKQIELIENFISKEEFNSIYKEAAALIINGYRQMAIENILTATMNGVKVYLSEKNITYNWALKNNFIFYSIENDLPKDLENNNIFLSTSDIENNFNSLKKFMQDNSVEKFQADIMMIIESD